jgi:hypothetical protein
MWNFNFHWYSRSVFIFLHRETTNHQHFSVLVALKVNLDLRSFLSIFGIRLQSRCHLQTKFTQLIWWIFISIFIKRSHWNALLVSTHTRSKILFIS